MPGIDTGIKLWYNDIQSVILHLAYMEVTMDTTKETDKVQPPYVSYKTFRSYLDRLRQEVIPSRLDASMMSNLSGQVRSQLRNALRYLDLIDENSVPTKDLERLVYAEGTERQQQFRDILKNSYTFIYGDEAGNFDITRATPKEFSDKFGETGLSGDTVRKAQAFFLNAATEADLPISPHLKRGSTTAATTRMVRSRNGQRTRRKPQEQSRGSVQQSSPPSPEPQRPSVQGAVLTSLQTFLAKFPDFDPEWSEEAQAKWLDTYDRIADRLVTMAQQTEAGYNEDEDRS
jgi:hypothetical protein